MHRHAQPDVKLETAATLVGDIECRQGCRKPGSEVGGHRWRHTSNASGVPSGGTGASDTGQLPLRLLNSLSTLVALLEKQNARLDTLNDRVGVMEGRVDGTLERIEDLAKKMDITLNTFSETTTRAIRADLSAAVSGDMDIVKTEAAELRLTAKEAIASGARILRFEAVLERLSDVPARFTGIENRISNVEASLGRLSQHSDDTSKTAHTVGTLIPILNQSITSLLALRHPGAHMGGAQASPPTESSRATAARAQASEISVLAGPVEQHQRMQRTAASRPPGLSTPPASNGPARLQRSAGKLLQPKGHALDAPRRVAAEPRQMDSANVISTVVPTPKKASAASPGLAAEAGRNEILDHSRSHIASVSTCLRNPSGRSDREELEAPSNSQILHAISGRASRFESVSAPAGFSAAVTRGNFSTSVASGGQLRIMRPSDDNPRDMQERENRSVSPGRETKTTKENQPVTRKDESAYCGTSVSDWVQATRDAGAVHIKPRVGVANKKRRLLLDDDCAEDLSPDEIRAKIRAQSEAIASTTIAPADVQRGNAQSNTGRSSNIVITRQVSASNRSLADATRASKGNAVGSSGNLADLMPVKKRARPSRAAKSGGHRPSGDEA